MKILVSKDEMFIHYDQRSVDLYYPQLAKHMHTRFGEGVFSDEPDVIKILEEFYDWCATTFQQIMGANDDWLFVNYLFSFHESSIRLLKRVWAGEDVKAKFNISPDDMAQNRRIFRLILEQACDVDYTKSSNPTYPLLRYYNNIIEDLLYIGKELLQAAALLSELRMLPDSLEVVIEKNGRFDINRKGKNEQVFNAVFPIIQNDFTKGIMDDQGVHDMKAAIKNCFGIDYDIAASLVVQIKQKLNPKHWEFQTIEEGILVQNLVANGASQANAEDFYAGLTLTRSNKLALKDSVYQVNSLDRYFFRPVLEVIHKGKPRHFIGVEKWAESIVVLVTNNFQWNKAPAEWKKNACFTKFLTGKAGSHDALLEDEVEKILTTGNIPFFRNITSFKNGKKAISINVAGVGEIDFIWLDTKNKRIVVADCKYNRARYDMIGFSNDFSTISKQYEHKIKGKAGWVDKNRELVYGHFLQKFPALAIDIFSYDIEELFIINTPTLYMYLDRVNTVCFLNLEDFIDNNYMHPSLTLSTKIKGKITMSVKPYPYF